MEMTMPKYRVYIRVDENNYITQIEGECSLSNLGDLNAPDIHLIDEGEGGRFYHAQGRYLEKPIMDFETGSYNYAYINGEVVERTEAEKMADVQDRPISYSESERLTTLEMAFAEFVEMMLGGAE